ncbi:MAG: hypothetical protein Q7S00_07265, partial [bacterium]|nr:hypothetical protein [bacterium]
MLPLIVIALGFLAACYKPPKGAPENNPEGENCLDCHNPKLPHALHLNPSVTVPLACGTCHRPTVSKDIYEHMNNPTQLLASYDRITKTCNEACHNKTMVWEARTSRLG